MSDSVTLYKVREPAKQLNCICGKKGTSRIDPYIHEIYDKTVYRIICDDCYRQKLADI